MATKTKAKKTKSPEPVKAAQKAEPTAVRVRATAPTRPVVNVKCRRGADKITAGQDCNSLSAENLGDPGAPQAQFRCVKCRYTWTVPVGGTFNIL